MINADWEVEVVHTLRDDNRCADCIAGFALKMEEELCFWDVPPSFVNVIVDDDCRGSYVPRGF